ncbi:MAG: leucyl aminopeptidase, partial [Rubrivivax sp.]|nr:leucyl aminopeptidase [Rubrivivax sp.]
MDFHTQTPPAAGIAGVAADALLVVLCGSEPPVGLEAPLATLLDDAIGHGDLELKAARVVVLHRPAGLKSKRLVFAAAADASPKAVKAAFAAGVGAVKGAAVKKLAVAVAADASDHRHAEALVAAVGDAVYTYRHTRPSAPPAPVLE